MSSCVQDLPSSHAAPAGAKETPRQPPWPSHASPRVHAFASSHAVPVPAGGPERQRPSTSQTSVAVQGSPSLHEVPGLAYVLPGRQTPEGSHWSPWVHAFPSWQLAPGLASVVATHTPNPSQALAVLQSFPSSQGTLGDAGGPERQLA